MAKKKKRKWIQKIGMKKGSLTAMAKRAGMSISQYCAQGNLSPLAKKRCALAKTLGKMRKKKKKT